MASETPTAKLERRLEAFLERIRAEARVPGIGIALSLGGTRIAASAGTLAVGDATPLGSSSRFELGCIVKLLRALTTLELARAGRIDLDAPLGVPIGELRGSPVGADVRVEHLLSHTSGHEGTDPLEPAGRALTWPRFVAYLREARQLFRAGQVFDYEHSEAVLLERLLERATGRAASTLCRELVLDPLCVPVPVADSECDRTLRVGRHAYDAAAGRWVPVAAVRPSAFWQAAFSSLTVSLRELVTLGEALVATVGRADAPALPDWTRERLTRPAVRLPRAVGGPLSELIPVAFGLGAAHLRDGWLGNTGLTQGQCIGLRYDPRRGIVVAVGLNATAPHLRDLVLGAVCRCLSPPERTPERTTTPFGFELGTLAGTYRGSGGRSVVATLEEERLVCEIGSRHRAETLRAVLAIDADGVARLESPVPQLSLGFFREPERGTPGLMVGLNAFKRVGAGRAARRRP